MFHILASDPDTIASNSRSCEKDLEAKDRPAICGRFRLDVENGSQLSGQNCCQNCCSPRMHCRIRFFFCDVGTCWNNCFFQHGTSVTSDEVPKCPDPIKKNCHVLPGEVPCKQNMDGDWLTEIDGDWYMWRTSYSATLPPHNDSNNTHSHNVCHTPTAGTHIHHIPTRLRILIILSRHQ